MDRKTIIAFSFATNRLGAGLVGLVYYNPEIHNDNYNHINIPKFGHYIHEYGLKDTGSVSHRSTFRNEKPATNGGNTSSNNTIIILYFHGILFFIVNHHCIKLQGMTRHF